MLILNYNRRKRRAWKHLYTYHEGDEILIQLKTRQDTKPDTCSRRRRDIISSFTRNSTVRRKCILDTNNIFQCLGF